MIKKEFLGHTLHIKGFKVEVKEENIKRAFFLANEVVVSPRRFSNILRVLV